MRNKNYSTRSTWFILYLIEIVYFLSFRANEKVELNIFGNILSVCDSWI